MINFFKKADELKRRFAPHFLRFMDSRLCPITVGALVFIGHTFNIEFWCNLFVMIPAALYLLLSDRIRGFLPALLMILYQITPEHSSVAPGFSDYYFSAPIFVPLLILVLLLVLSFIIFFAKNVLPRISRATPMLFPSAALCLSFFMGGAFSDRWDPKNLFYALMQTLGFILVFLTVYYGIRNEKSEEFIPYLTDLALIVASVIGAELLCLYITNDALIVDGSIVKEEVHLGWGMWNPIGFSLTVLIPLIMRGALFGESKRPMYLIGSIATWIFAVMSMSRNALLFSTLAVAACVVIGAFFGKMKLLCRILTAIGFTGAVALAVLLWDKLPGLITSFLNDNGRFELWKTAVDNFLEFPIFGAGFYGFGRGNNFAAFLPWLAHNTPLAVMSAAGGVGIICYVYYRVQTIRPFAKSFTLEKLMLLLPILVTLGMSLIDNYVFHVYTMFIYNVCLATVFRLNDEAAEKASEKNDN